MTIEEAGRVLPVDHTYVVNLDRRADRLAAVTKQLGRVGVEFERFSAVDAASPDFLRYSWANSKVDKTRIKTPGALACLMSHANVICNAKMRGYSRIAVFEDDVVLHRDFANLIGAATAGDWELLYLGATQVEWEHVEPSICGTYRASRTLGTFAMLIDGMIYDDLLDAYAELLEPADEAIARFVQPRKRCRVVYPNLCAADVRNSDIRGECNQVAFARLVRLDMENYYFEGFEPAEIATRSWLDDITIGITHFDRPEHLGRLIASIRDRYPAVRIVVADNSKIHRDMQLPGGAELIQLAPDDGVCASRNACATACRTKYLLQLEEDFVFTDETDLHKFWEVLEGDPLVGIVGGSLWGRGNLHDYATDFSFFDETIYFRPASGAWRAINGVPCRPCDMVFDFYLARREALVSCPWDNDLVIGGELPDFFLRLTRLGRWKTVHTPTVRAQHDVFGRSEHYTEHRQRSKEFLQLFLAKHRFRSMDVDPRLNWRHAPDGCVSRPNIIVHGAPHSGLTVVAKMLSQLGWNTAYTVDEKLNTPLLKDINKAIISGNFSDETRRQMLAFVRGQRQPWVIKDVGFASTIDKWVDTLSAYGSGTREYPLLVSVRRDQNAIEQHAGLRRKRGEPQIVTRDLLRKIETDFANWPWGKLEID